MDKKKSLFVTVLFAVMLAGLDYCLWRISTLGFLILTGALALYGYWMAAGAFYACLIAAPEDKLEPPVVLGEADLLPEDFSMTVEEIIKEVEGA